MLGILRIYWNTNKSFRLKSNRIVTQTFLFCFGTDNLWRTKQLLKTLIIVRREHELSTCWYWESEFDHIRGILLFIHTRPGSFVEGSWYWEWSIFICTLIIYYWEITETRTLVHDKKTQWDKWGAGWIRPPHLPFLL